MLVAHPLTDALCIPFAIAWLCSGAADAQTLPLAPTADTTIVVPSGTLHYSSILVPAGVTVRFVAPGFGPASLSDMPAVVMCDCDAIVHGTLWLSGDNINDRPAGWVTIGYGSGGLICNNILSPPPGGGLHAGTYGSAVPFSLEGGSPGGGILSYAGANCTPPISVIGGGEGGGTLVLLAGGRIEIDGSVTADGYGGAAGGSGGSILLRGNAGVTVLPTGTIAARGWPTPTPPGPWSPTLCSGAPGYIRLDAWGTTPILQGTIDPPPTALTLPHLRTQAPPRIGTQWLCEVFAPENAAVFVATSGIQGNGTPTPFGPLGIDGASATILAYAAITPTGHDPFVTLATPVPNAPALVGLTFWVQALAIPPALPGRVSNTIAVAVQ